MNQLAAFVAVAEAGTISGAAERLHVSPSALSAAVTELERHLQTQLLHRRKAKGVSVTASGELVLPRARYLLHQAAELEADARSEDRGVVGVVRVGCYPSLAPTVLPAMLHDFTTNHPDARIEVFEANQDELAAALETGEIDIAIMYDIDLHPSWRTAALAQLRIHVVLPAEHRLAGNPDPIDLADLAEDPMILLDSPPANTQAFASCARAGFSPVVSYRARTYETARSLVGRGLGWAMFMQRPATELSYEGHQVVVREIAAPDLEPVQVLLVWEPGSLLSRATRTLITDAVALAEADGLPLPRIV